MDAKKLVVGEFYRDIDKPGIKLVYCGLVKEQPFIGQHTFDPADNGDYLGSICTASEVEKYISPFLS
tara:strand:- start:274 stop:474 length:201 start_codon:yes stop_codon:yes gene_type:complete